ncbi:eryA [Symbiodinium necroappetens]|uniref:EryA protein n=1 Tax=Symbiodinium necroappetens TaxID=1628268 RepID=A0A813AQQ2_9DINO|nr:eryA [Symbiodinium necroappetens]
MLVIDDLRILTCMMSGYFLHLGKCMPLESTLAFGLVDSSESVPRDSTKAKGKMQRTLWITYCCHALHRLVVLPPLMLMKGKSLSPQLVSFLVVLGAAWRGGWDHQLYFCEENQQGKTYARHGGFIEGAELFDLTYFGLGTAEGVFAALSNLDWYQLALPQAGVYTGYIFGLTGPSMTALVSEVRRQMQYLLGIPVSAFPSLRVQGCDGEAAQAVQTKRAGVNMHLTVGPRQEDLLREVLREGRISALALGAIECLAGLTKALISMLVFFLFVCRHCDAGFVFVLLSYEVVSCLRHQEVPPNIHFQELNPHIFLENSRLNVPTDELSLSSEDTSRLDQVTGTSQEDATGTGPPWPKRVAFLFTGQGSQLPEMGRQLDKTDDAQFGMFGGGSKFECPGGTPDPGRLALIHILSNTLEIEFFTSRMSFAIKRCHGAKDLREWLFAPHELGIPAEGSTARSQIAIFVLEYALSEMWKVGEYAAAVLAGTMSLQVALRLVTRRAELIDEMCKPGIGAMAAIFASVEDVEKARQFESNRVLADGCKLLWMYVQHEAVNGECVRKWQLKAKCFLAKLARLNIPHAMHSPLMAPILPELRKAIEGCQLQPPCEQIAFISSLAGTKVSNALCDPSHDEAKPVLFSQGDEVDSILTSSRALGIAFNRPSELTPQLGCKTRVDARGTATFESTLDLDSQMMQLFKQHRVSDKIVLPGASHLLLAAASHIQLAETVRADAAVRLSDAVFEVPFLVPDSKVTKIHCHASAELTEICSIGVAAPSSTIVHARFGASAMLPNMEQTPGILDKWHRSPHLQNSSRADVSQLYTSFTERGLSYGESFRTLRNVTLVSDEVAVAQLCDPCVVGSAQAWEHKMQLLHPAVLDGAFQLLVMLAARGRHGDQEALYLPFSVRRTTLAVHCHSRELWAGVRVQERTETAVVADIEIFSSEGQVVACLEAASCRRSGQAAGTVKSQLTQHSMHTAEESSECLYHVQWKDVNISRGEDNMTSLPAPVALVSSGDSLRSKDLAERIGFADVAVGLLLNCVISVDDAVSSIKAGSIGTVVLDGLGEQLYVLKTALQLLQAALASTVSPRLLFVTGGVQPPEMSVQQHAPDHAGLWGLARSASMESPDLRVTCVDLNGRDWQNSSCVDLSPWLCAEAALVHRSTVLAARLGRHDLKPTWPLALHMPSRGSLKNLKARPAAQNGEVEVRVEAIGLNFRDVLNVVNLAGSNSEGLRCGDDAFGIVWGPPPRDSFWFRVLVSAAAALPTVYTTVDVAFAELAKLQKGEKVLVHAATGGVGLVAVQYAQRLGAEVYATAGREEKKQFLKDIGVKFIASSRNGESFETEMRTLLEEGGRFVEIGKRDVWSPEKVASVRPDVKYCQLAIDAVCENEPDRFQALLKRLEQDLQGSWKPLEMHVFEGLGKGEEALRFLQRAQHIGKVVLTVPHRMKLWPEASYLLSGGLGALGLTTAKAMAEEGAKSFLLFSRSGCPGPELGQHWAWLQQSSLEVQALACDVASPAGARELKRMQVFGSTSMSLGGKVLDDALVPQLTVKHLERTYGPKVTGAKHLYSAAEGRLTEVLFTFGLTGFLAWGAADGEAKPTMLQPTPVERCLDALAHHWHLSGVPAQSLQWGPWLEAGMAAGSLAKGSDRSNVAQRLHSEAQSNSFHRLKMAGISNESGLVYQYCLKLSIQFFVVMVVSRAVVAVHGAGKTSHWSSPRLRFGTVDCLPEAVNLKMTTLKEDVPPLSRCVTDMYARIVSGGLDMAITEVAYDSLSSIELRNRLAAEAQEGIKNTLVFDHPTLRAIADLDVFSRRPFEVHVEMVCLQEIPSSRFDLHEVFAEDIEALGNVMYVRHGGFVQGAELFDAGCFGMSAAEAKAIDPQQRLALEMSYSACHNAGRTKQTLRGSHVGVFVGQCSSDWAKMSAQGAANPYTGPGTHSSISANRISYNLGLQGASMSIDTACSSSLVALDIAYQKLGFDLMTAIVTGVQLNLIAEPFVAFCKARMLSPDGRCKTFDISANGYARSEGCGSVFLQRAAEADRQDHPTGEWVLVAASAANQNGQSSTLTAPNGLAQQRAIQKAVQLAKISSTQLSLVECHGTGTALGDPVETGALKAVLGPGRSMPVQLAAVKTNLGVTPPNLHLAKLNPKIELDASQLELRRQPFPWREALPRLLRHRATAPNEVHFDCPVHSDVFHMVSQHVVYGEVVVPGMVFVEMALEAARAHLGPQARLRTVHMLWPCVVPKDSDADGKQVTLRLAIIGNKRFELRSQGPDDDAWTVHCEGRVEATAVETTAQDVDSDTKPANASTEGDEGVNSASLYSLVDRSGLHLGPMFQVCYDIRRNADGISCQLQLSPDVSDEGYIIHPCLLDGSIHAACAMVAGDTTPMLKIFAGVGKVSVHASVVPMDHPLVLHLHVTENTDKEQVFSCRVFSQSGSLLWLLEDVVFRKVLPDQVQKAGARKTAGQISFFESKWVGYIGDAESTHGFLPFSNSDEQWLFLADAGLIDLLKAEVGEKHVCCTSLPCVREDFEVAQMVYIPSPDDSPLDVVENGIGLIQMALRMNSSPVVWFVLHATQATDARSLKGEAIPWHAGLWGLARCFRLESPGSFAGCVDLGVNCNGSEDIIARLRKLKLHRKSGVELMEPELLLQLQSPSLSLLVHRLEDTTSKFRKVDLGPRDGSIAISGGTSGLGLLLATWFAEKGAGHVALLSRTGNISQEPTAAASYAKLQSTGVATTLQCCDISVEEVLDDHLIADLARNHFANVFKPKVDGSVKGPQQLNLHKAFFNLGLESTDGSKVDFFVLFSSVAAMLGSRGQANYCAANTFLDAFALHRCGQGLPALSVQWGPWAEVGMAARVGTRESGGYLRLDPNSSLQALGAALAATSSPGGVLGISRIDWSSFLAVQRKVPCFLTNFKHLKKAAGASIRGEGVSEEFISSTIIDALRSVIGDPDWTDFSVPFMDMGLDSLSVVEFRNLVQASFEGVHLASTALCPEFASDDAAEDVGGPGAALGVVNAPRLSGDNSKYEESIPDVRDFNVSEPVAIAGCAARFAGCSGNSPDE